MLQEKSRRQAIVTMVRTGGLLVLGGMGLYAFAPDSPGPSSSPLEQPAVPSPKAPEIKIATTVPTPTFSNHWRLLDLPAATGITRIEITPTNQNPPIGISELYFGLSETIPAVVVAAVLTPSTIRREIDDKGSFGFQKIEEPFVPDISQVQMGTVDSLDEVLPLAEALLPQIDALSKGRLRKGTSMIGLVPRPQAGSRFALVFDTHATETGGVPSQKSYISTGFNFLPQKPSNRVI